MVIRILDLPFLTIDDQYYDGGTYELRGMSRDLIYRLLDLSLFGVANKCRCHFESKGDLI